MGAGGAVKALLMHADRNFDWERELPAQAEELTQDLGMQVIFWAMAAGDDFLLQVAQRAVFGSLSDPDAILYRQHALSDCLEHPEVVSAIYNLTVETLAERRKIWGWFQGSPELNLHYAVQVMELLERMLRRLLQEAVENDGSFRSTAFKRFFAMLREELDEAYFAEINRHLGRLQFKRGALISAGLGKGNGGVDIALRRPLTDKQRWSEFVLGPRDERLSFDVHPRDDAGHQALENLRARGINLVANALQKSVEHVLDFFIQLRSELGFYLGCLNLRKALDARGCATSLPKSVAASELSLSAHGLYDAAFALTVEGGVISNDLSAGDKQLVVITGANQGGKSTFLRSLGLAQLLMQAGMFVPAIDFSGNVVTGVFTHFKREEDSTMTRGKLDEELSRMSRTVDLIAPGALLLCNESFASTNEREGSDIGEQVIGSLNEAGVKVVIVTHLIDLAQRLRRLPSDKALFLRAERLTNGTRTFKIREGEALPTSFGQDLYDDIFRRGYPPEPTSESRVTGSGSRDDPSFSRPPRGPA